MRGGGAAVIPPVRITQRELQFIQGVIDGKRNKQIAWDLGVTESTAKVTFCRLFKKIGVDGRLALAQWGRTYVEAQRRIAERYNELNPEAPLSIGTPLKYRDIAERDVVQAIVLTGSLTWNQRTELAKLLVPQRREEGQSK